jgi:hypothetical protein
LELLSTPNAKFMCLDIILCYLSAPLDKDKYMGIAFALLPPWIIDQYDLANKVHNGHIYVEMRCAVCGLPQAGILANKFLKKRLAPHGYFECTHTPGLWKHATQPISFNLMVDNVGVKYMQQEDIEHLIKCIKEKYKLTMDWGHNLYSGICLKWDHNACTLCISMPGYILKQMQKYNHTTPTKQQHCPYAPQPKQYGSKAQRTLPQDTSPPLS